MTSEKCDLKKLFLDSFIDISLYISFKVSRVLELYAFNKANLQSLKKCNYFPRQLQQFFYLKINLRLKLTYLLSHLNSLKVLSGSKRGIQLFSVMQRGDLVPHEVVLDILAEKMVETVPGANGFLIDGFPLDMEEALSFEKQIVPVTRLGNVLVPKATLDLRPKVGLQVTKCLGMEFPILFLKNTLKLSKKSPVNVNQDHVNLIKATLRIIHLKLDPKEMRGRLDKRENFDDKPDAVNKRIETFQSKTLPVLETYKYKASLEPQSLITLSPLCRRWRWMLRWRRTS